MYLAPMAFAYNTSFHRTINSTPFKVTYGVNARTPDFDQRKQYGEDLPTDLYQRMQVCHEMAKNLAHQHNQKAVDQCTKDHDKKLMPRTFKEGERVLLKVKDFKLKKRKLCEEWRGPFLITKIFPNNTALIKTKFGKHEVLYNFMMLKHYNEKELEKMTKIPIAEEDKNWVPQPKCSKRNVENKPNEGPMTRSKTKEIAKNAHQSTNAQMNGAQINCQNSNNFHKTHKHGAQIIVQIGH